MTFFNKKNRYKKLKALTYYILTVISMAVIILVGLAGALAMLSMANHGTQLSCAAHGIGGAITAGGCLYSLSFLTEIHERRFNV